VRIDPDRNCPYNSGSTAFGDVVLSSRARLARNIKGFPFVNRATEGVCNEILDLVKPVCDGETAVDTLEWVDLAAQDDPTRLMMVERHLVSSQLASAALPAAVAVGSELARSIMVNEEDHLRIQSIRPGLDFGAVHADVDALDDRLEQQVSLAFHHRWGYLTACPTNLGTGARFSVMLHLPGLRITKELERVAKACRDTSMAIRGYRGEGSKTVADLYQISNQATLGRTEDDLCEQLSEQLLPGIIEYERRARMLLIERDLGRLDDRTHRAFGLLREARLLDLDEAMTMLGRLRMGVCLERLSDIDINTVNQLIIEIQPGHLRWRFGDELDGNALDESRSRLVRERLAA
jgi:protein arginine kinase